MSVNSEAYDEEYLQEIEKALFPLSSLTESDRQLFQEAFLDGWDLRRLFADLDNVKQKYWQDSTQRFNDGEKINLCGLLSGYNSKAIGKKRDRGANGIRVDFCRGLYRYVECLTNREENELSSWRDIAKWLEAARYKQRLDNKKYRDWGNSPDITNFFGREWEREDLKQCVVNRQYRLVVLSGMFWIGKTFLAKKVAEEIQDEFEYVIWRSLVPSQTPQEMLADLLACFPVQPAANSVPELISRLQEYRCLIILDSWEKTYKPKGLAGEYREGYSDYRELVMEVGTSNHQSCILLVSQLESIEQTQLEGIEKVEFFTVKGLGKTAESILDNKSLSDREKWQQLIDRYDGNPGILKIIVAKIRKVFSGSVSRFLAQQTEMDLSLPRDLRDELGKVIQQLSKLEKEIICYLAFQDRPITLEDLKENMDDSVSSTDFNDTVESLMMRSLIAIENDLPYSIVLVPMFRKYVKTQEG
ncbi:hypothetical protein [Roseofilum casamattae]|uniref:NB-ARC domain-containing protein n=1 Tax=Roseofilum casamattae BLCC-M143 TaxID=3022442 RepID=A0ABT7BYT6_9CYAN|nr:hypothetical protein [Roseofilum casamattae]MDJ1183952.1 hypothetical protein [Roseofilum casamattae BLCC-M143]